MHIPPSPQIAVACLCILLVLMTLVLRPTKKAWRSPSVCRKGAIRVEVVGGANSMLVCPAWIGDHSTLFLIDTGYGGAPVLSLPLLHSEGGDHSTLSSKLSALQSVRSVGQEAEVRALHRFMRRQRCVSFTAGGSQTLMGIGASASSTTDILLGPGVHFEGVDAPAVGGRECCGYADADVYVTTSMPTAHILTMDWLRQASPCMIRMQAGELRIGMSEAELADALPRFRLLTRQMSGGAFVARVRVAGGSFIRCTVDTGAACYVSLSARAASGFRCERRVARLVRQSGVNDERVCADVVHGEVTLGDEERMPDVPIFVSTTAPTDVDGYVGIALLRHYDLLVANDSLYVRRNERAFDSHLLDAGFEEGACGASVPCLSE